MLKMVLQGQQFQGTQSRLKTLRGKKGNGSLDESILGGVNRGSEGVEPLLLLGLCTIATTRERNRCMKRSR